MAEYFQSRIQTEKFCSDRCATCPVRFVADKKQLAEWFFGTKLSSPKGDFNFVIISRFQNVCVCVFEELL
jgi:hypothetical protein